MTNNTQTRGETPAKGEGEMYQQNKRYQVGNWKIDVPCDVELYREYDDGTPEMIPHSNYGERFINEATPQEKEELINKGDTINR